MTTALPPTSPSTSNTRARTILFITYAIVPPAGVKSADSVVTIKQTSLPTSKWGASAGLQVVDERDNGIVVSGFKVLATGAVLADEILFGNFQSLAAGQGTLRRDVCAPGGYAWIDTLIAPSLRTTRDQRAR